MTLRPFNIWTKLRSTLLAQAGRISWKACASASIATNSRRRSSNCKSFAKARGRKFDEARFTLRAPWATVTALFTKRGMIKTAETAISKLPTVLLKPGEADRLIAGHPWVYQGNILRLTAPAEDGAVVQVK